MNLIAIWTAIKARIDADTGTGGISNAGTPLISGIYSSFAVTGASTASKPYIVFDVDGAQQQDGFEIDIIELSIRLHVFARMDSATTSGFDKCSAIIDRLYGDGIDNVNRIPSYGFHRHELTISSGKYTGSIMHRTGMAQEHDEDHLHFIESYSLLISNAP